MAASVSPETASTLKISYEALVERSKLLVDPENSNGNPNKSTASGAGCTRGMLHLPSTTKLEKQRRRNRGKSHQDQDRSMTHKSTTDHGLVTEISGKRSKFKQESRGSELCTSRPARSSRDGGLDQGDLSSGWSQHEHKRVEKLLSRWSGDVAKLKPVIRAW